MPSLTDKEVNDALDELNKVKAAATAAGAAADQTLAHRTEPNADDAVAKAQAARVAADRAKQQATFVSDRIDDIKKDLKEARDKETRATEAIAKVKASIKEKEDAAKTLAEKQQRAVENAAASARAAKQASGNLGDMRQKLARLGKEATTGTKLQEAAAAVAKAKKEFDDRATAATAACSAMWFPSLRAYPKEVGERDAADKFYKEKQDEYEQLKLKKEKEFESYKETVEDVEAQIKRHEKDAKTHTADAADLENQLKAIQKELPDLNTDLTKQTQQAATQKAKKEKLQSLADFKDNPPVAAAQAQADRATNQAIAAYDALFVSLVGAPAKARVMDKRTDIDIARGAAFDTTPGAAHAATTPSGQALAKYQSDPPTIGQTARTLAPLLATKNRADFLTHMEAEFNAGKCVRTIDPSGNRKYEYPDGTMVRHKVVATPFRPPPSYSVEVKHTPANPDIGPGSVAFKVDERGRPVPKNPTDTKNPYPNNPQRAAYVDSVMTAGHHSIPL